MKKTYATGLVIGKFYPPHRGHQYLIDTALAQAEQVTVIVCDKKGQAISGELRAQWLRQIHPQARVMVIEDIYDDTDSKAWADNTLRWLGSAPDAVFSSEEYGDAYAKLMGSAHVKVDQERVTVPISATQIRADPLAHLDFLEPVVRAHYLPRVCVIGAESTGTTTMAKALAAHYRTAWVPEYGRTYWEGKLTTKDASDWTTAEFVHIARQQAAMEDALALVANGILICDTDAFATSVWHERYLAHRAAEVDAMSADRRGYLYLVTNVDIPFVQDGTRDGEHIRHWMHDLFVARLQEDGRAYIVLSGAHEDRLKKAIAAIDTHLLTYPKSSAIL